MSNYYFSVTIEAGMILAFNGSLSAASSILIMSIIFRSSSESRTSAYHIIMFFMSFWDFIASVAMALNTIPMPSDVNEIYPFVAGMTLGNISTCEAQGLLAFMGSMLVLFSNTTLNVYYVFTFRYGMGEDDFKRRIMPVMIVLSIAASITIPINALRMGYFNPSPVRGFCWLQSYPQGCSNHDHSESDHAEGDDTQCIRGEVFDGNKFRQLGFIILGSAFLVLLCSLVIVIITVLDAELAIRRSRRIRRRSRSVEAGNRATFQDTEFKRTRAILIQALMYIGAFLLTYAWPFIIALSPPFPENNMAFLLVFFPPLQGFFNAIIFVYQKVHTLRQTNTRLSFYQGFKQVILSPSTIPQALVSRIEIIEEDTVTRSHGNSNIHRIQTSASQRQRNILSNVPGLRRLSDDATPNSMNVENVGSSSLSLSSAGADDGRREEDVGQGGERFNSPERDLSSFSILGSINFIMPAENHGDGDEQV